MFHWSISRRPLAGLLLLSASVVSKDDKEILQAWQDYIRIANLLMQERLHGGAPFLWIDELAEQSHRSGPVRSLIVAWANIASNVAYLSALSAIAGSVLGGLTSSITTWLSQRAQARAGQIAREMSRRDEL